MKTKETESKKCACGCGESVARLFRPGHDARLAGVLTTLGTTDRDAALERASAFGPKFVTKVERSIESRLAKAAKKAKPAASDLDDETIDLLVDLDDEGWLGARNVTAKVGRWTYDGSVADGVFTYTDKKGGEHTTTKFEVTR
jgi:hypothetical protein